MTLDKPTELDELLRAAEAFASKTPSAFTVAGERGPTEEEARLLNAARAWKRARAQTKSDQECSSSATTLICEPVFIVSGYGLDTIGRRLKTPRAQGEPDADYRARLVAEMKARQRGSARTSE